MIAAISEALALRAASEGWTPERLRSEALDALAHLVAPTVREALERREALDG